MLHDLLQILYSKFPYFRPNSQLYFNVTRELEEAFVDCKHLFEEEQHLKDIADKISLMILQHFSTFVRERQRPVVTSSIHGEIHGSTEGFSDPEKVVQSTIKLEESDTLLHP